MASSFYATAGCKIYIGDAAIDEQIDDFTEADFTGVTWTQIDGWSQMGAFGDSAQAIVTSLINRGRDAKQKGTANAGTMTNIFVERSDDPGQTAFRNAARPEVKQNYPFRIDFNDAPEGGTPTQKMFIGLAMGASYQGGDANTARTISCTVEINSNIVTVPASA